MEQLVVELISIKKLVENGENYNNILIICDCLYEMVGFLCEDYPKHKSWFYFKHLPETLNKASKRDIIFAKGKDGTIYGTAFIKYENEKKICTIYVIPEARGKGLGTALVEKSMEILGTTTPIISFASYKLPMFKGLIEKYGWKQTQVLDGVYNENNKELVFNGYLEK